LVISDNYRLYFTNLKPCIMPTENANAESQQEDRDGDHSAPAPIGKPPPMIDRFASV
jgi:hypothetical protein